MKPDSPFLHLLQLVQQKLDRLQNQAERVGLFGSPNDEAAYEAALQLEEQAEKTLLLIRQLPVCTGRPSAKADVERVVLSSVPVEIGFTPEGWFRLVIPALLPKKNKGNVNYYRGILYPAMQWCVFPFPSGLRRCTPVSIQRCCSELSRNLPSLVLFQSGNLSTGIPWPGD